MKIVLAGQRSFGTAVLGALLARKEKVAAVVAPPGDRLANEAVGRGLRVAEKATEELVRAVGADLLIAAHSHDFIGRRTRNALAIGAIGFHPSLLPRHRGRDAVRWTIHMGDPVAGGTVYWLSDRMDGGPIAAQDWCFVRPGWTHRELWREELFGMGIRLICQTLDQLDQGRMVAIPQVEEAATWEPSWDRPPVLRPELLEIGPMPRGLKLVNSRHCGDLPECRRPFDQDCPTHGPRAAASG